MQKKDNNPLNFDIHSNQSSFSEVYNQQKLQQIYKENYSKTITFFCNKKHMQNLAKTFSSIDTKMKNLTATSDFSPMSANQYISKPDTDHIFRYHPYNKIANNYNKCATQVKNLTAQLANLKQTNHNIATDLSSQHAQQQIMRQYQKISSHNLQTQKQLKQNLNQSAYKLEQEIQHIFRNRINNQKIYQKQITNQLQQLKQSKQKLYKQYIKNKNINFYKINKEVFILQKQINCYVEQNVRFKNQIFGMLSNIRNRLRSQIDQEENKRKGFDQIMGKLLEKSCKKAQEVLRRNI